MHANERTLIANLGFSDPDKKNPLHDLACQYLAMDENRLKIANMFARERGFDTKRPSETKRNRLKRNSGVMKRNYSCFEDLDGILRPNLGPRGDACPKSKIFANILVSSNLLAWK